MEKAPNKAFPTSVPVSLIVHKQEGGWYPSILYFVSQYVLFYVVGAKAGTLKGL